MLTKLRQFIRNSVGQGMIEVLIVLAMVAGTAIIIIPQLNNALENQTQSSVEVIDSVDTVSGEE